MLQNFDAGTCKLKAVYASSLSADKAQRIAMSISRVTTGQDVDERAPRFNLAGQRVAKDYKGIVVMKGRKFIQR